MNRNYSNKLRDIEFPEVNAIKRGEFIEFPEVNALKRGEFIGCAWYVLHAGFLCGLFFGPEDGGCMSLGNVR
jgi:hypothetical protein